MMHLEDLLTLFTFVLNDKFLGYIELLAKFDHIKMEHVKRIKYKDTQNHYLIHNIQDKFITLVSNKVQKEIIAVVQ